MDGDANTPPRREDEKQTGAVSVAGRQTGGDDAEAGTIWTILGCGYLILCCAVLVFLVFGVLQAAVVGIDGTPLLGTAMWALAIPPVLVMVWQATRSGKKLAITAVVMTAPLAGAPAMIGLALLLAAFAFLFWLGRKTRSTMLPAIAAVALFVLPTLHPMLAGVTLTHRERRHPAQEITEKVAMPESLFLQMETVRQPGAPRIPGIRSVSLTYAFFKDHLLQDYLGGARLKVLAAKNDRGELALYRLEDEPFWATTLQHCRAEEIKLKATLPAPTLEDKLARKKASALLERICSRVRENIEDGARIVASPEELPPMRYRARLWETEIRLPWWPRWLLRHTQRMDIYDNASGRRIAWAERHDAPTWWVVNLIRKMSGAQATAFNLKTAAKHENQLLRFMEEVLFSPSPPTPPR